MRRHTSQIARGPLGHWPTARRLEVMHYARDLQYHSGILKNLYSMRYSTVLPFSCCLV